MAKRNNRTSKGGKGKNQKGLSISKNVLQTDPYEYNGYTIRAINGPCIIAIPKDVVGYYHGLKESATEEQIESAVDEVKTFVDSQRALEE